MNQTLEETLAAICAKHDLTNFSIEYRGQAVDAGYAFSATCHWDGFSRTNIACTSSYGSDVKSAVSGVIAEMHKDRTYDAVDVPSLPSFEVAA